MSINTRSKVDVIRETLAAHGPLTSAQLAAHTGIDIKSISAMVAYSCRKGLVERGWFRNQRCYGIDGAFPDATLPEPDMQQNRIQSDAFYRLAMLAADYERGDRFKEAEAHWLDAAELASKVENIQFCRHRAAFCHHALASGWKYSERGEEC
ncbi:ANR family transcriptional regulator [Enterobacter hormaechei]|uniref:ANR family transcriptional regulator n=1 Tax=Enterobacter hormaechei TaxID=158836 RepID=UPI003D6F164F